MEIKLDYFDVKTIFSIANRSTLLTLRKRAFLARMFNALERNHQLLIMEEYDSVCKVLIRYNHITVKELKK